MLKELLEVFQMILNRTKTVQSYLLFSALLVSLLSFSLLSLAGAIVFLERARILDYVLDDQQNQLDAHEEQLDDLEECP